MNFPKATKNPETGKYDKYAWPGGYPLFYITVGGLPVCVDCANEDTSDPVEYSDVNWENPQLYCDDCEERIESAYTEDICKTDSCNDRIMPGSEYCEDCDAGIREDIEEE